MDVRGIKSFVLRGGRMSDAQKRSYENLAPSFCISESKITDYKSIFGNSNPVIIEIGFGSGFATAEIADKNPSTNYLGIEVYRPGIGKLLWEIEKRSLKNIRIIEGDAAELLPRLLPGAAAGIHLFFPDPWPKKRHHKRRLVTRPFTETLRNCLLPGAYIYMVTDWTDYADWALAELSATPALVNQYEAFAPVQSWRPKTRFENKGLNKNHEIRELYFVRE
ncbi:MAG: tRNA (guanosine(46)-N7)-methyltransferase TrmB [Treponema sp.]|jgi:tRNA (guanine-N7-)-methyltransferase|nr:tRNA (guanosine(46)-N7)-methyltransferase TrmB [Treponema sp.]